MKKLLSLILAISILLSLTLSFSVNAEEGDGVVFLETFEDGKDNWSYNNESYSSKFVIDDKDSFEGKQSLLCIDDDTEANMNMLSERFKVEPSTLYKLGFDAKVVEGTRSKLYIQFYDEGGKRIYNNSMYASGADWKKYTFVHETPAEAAEGAIVISSASTTMGTTYFDNIFVSEVPQKAAELSKKLQGLKAGDVLEIENGVYEDIKITLTESGTK